MPACSACLSACRTAPAPAPACPKHPPTPLPARPSAGLPACSYVMGSVLGAGSFGVVRECTDRRSGRRFAVKSISKVPKNARATPRYLLKIQTEVDAMQQLGGSLDAVFLQVGGGRGLGLPGVAACELQRRQ